MLSPNRARRTGAWVMGPILAAVAGYPAPLHAQQRDGCLAPAPVRVRVVDARSARPLPAAAVWLNGRPLAVDSVGEAVAPVVPAGDAEVTARAAGLAPRTVVVPVCGPEPVRVFLRLAPHAVQLEQVVITAEERPQSVEGSSTTRIGRAAIDHLQPSSLADLLQLLPGQEAQLPSLASVRQSLLRQAPTSGSRDPGAGTDAERTNALGTSVVLDGVPMGTNASLQTTVTILNSGPATLPPFASTAGRGVDLRLIPADQIESVEVIRGVPSARHGDLTAGAILVTTRAGAQRPELRVRANPLTLETSAVAGWGRAPGEGVSADLNVVRSQDDPRTTLARLTRATLQLAWSATPREGWRSTLRLRAHDLLDELRQDPDDRRFQRQTGGRDRGARLEWRLTGGGSTPGRWSGELTAAAHLTEQVGTHQELVTRDIFPIGTARRDTLAPGQYGRSEYLSQLTVDGRPAGGYLRVEARRQGRLGRWRADRLVGIEGRTEANRGRGRLFDPLTPPRQNFGVGERPDDFTRVPALTQWSAYAEEQLRGVWWGRGLTVRAGARLDHLAGHGVPEDASTLVVPRLMVALQVTRALAVRGAHGVTTKAPTLSQRHPLPRYFDFTSFNHYPVVPAERLVLFTTRVIDPRTPGLGPARAAKSELALDWSGRGGTGSLTWFHERTSGAFGTTRVPFGVLVPQYRALSFPAGAPPRLDPVPARVDSVVALYDTPRNSRAIRTRGVELTMEPPEVRSLRTQFLLTGGWFATVAEDADREIPVEQFLGGTRQPARVGVYDGGRGSEAWRAITSVRLVHRAPAAGLVVSLLWQATWQEDDRPVGRLDGVPVGYVDRLGRITPLTRAEALTPPYATLVRGAIPMAERWERRPALHLVNLRLTKALPGGTQVAVFAHNALADRPLHARQRSPGYERRNDPLFFGVEFLAARFPTPSSPL